MREDCETYLQATRSTHIARTMACAAHCTAWIRSQPSYLRKVVVAEGRGEGGKGRREGKERRGEEETRCASTRDAVLYPLHRILHTGDLTYLSTKHGKISRTWDRFKGANVDRRCSRTREESSGPWGPAWGAPWGARGSSRGEKGWRRASAMRALEADGMNACQGLELHR